MGIKNYDIKFSYNDVTIEPAKFSLVNHRCECNPYDENGMLPIFTAPMTSVVNEYNFSLFEKFGINAILPRNYDTQTRLDFALNNKWAAFSLQEFNALFCMKNTSINIDTKAKILIDMANGHILKLYDLVKKARKIHGDKLTIMVGNIANPETYELAAESGVDYVRCSVGTGDGCITQTNTGIGYPIVSLIDEIVKIKTKLDSSGKFTKLPKIIADGGIRNYCDIIKAIAVGADYVMVGGLFSKIFESAGNCRFFTKEEGQIEMTWKEFTCNSDIQYKGDGHFLYKGKTVDIYKLFYGMASKMGQEDTKSKKGVPEGIVKMNRVEFKLEEWTHNFIHYIQSAMSYTNSLNLNALKQANVIVVSTNTYNSINH